MRQTIPSYCSPILRGPRPDSYIVPDEFGVEPIEYSLAKDFVCRHHYSHSFVYAIKSFGLFHKGSDFLRSELVGVATFSTPSNLHSVTRWTGLANNEGMELGRFVLLDSVAGNGETWFLARALRQLKTIRPETKCVLSYSDPMPRTNAIGETVFPGHWGSIYQSSSALYLGRAKRKVMYLNRNGMAIANRIFSKLRNGECGKGYSERILTAATGLFRAVDETPRAFVDRALTALRPVRHAGNHLYCFALGASASEKRRILASAVLCEHIRPASELPKQPDMQAAYYDRALQ